MSASCRDENALRFATLVALLTLLPVAAHQLGVLAHLPDPPGRIFDSDRITESAMAHPFGVPDSLPGMASYATTLALAVAARNCDAARRVLAIKLVADGCLAGFNVVRQVTRFGKLCSWCMATAVCTAAMVIAGRDVIATEAHALRKAL
ncbi:MAG TPA: vitamin K epoxide reductase family protein [Acidobacteriaceae bacterium]|nr:vitamin K epoxide reductase family protein [Acidobacteriaceae bacterium]